jgi:hypothetical protein
MQAGSEVVGAETEGKRKKRLFKKSKKKETRGSE